MNERIKDLAEKAGFITFSPEEDPHTPIDWSCDYSSELEKFAELIVEECAKEQHIRFCKEGDVSWDVLMDHFGLIPKA